MTSRERRREIRGWFESLGGAQAPYPLDESAQRILLGLVAEMLGMAGDLEDQKWAIYTALGGRRRSKAPLISAPARARLLSTLIVDAMTELERTQTAESPLAGLPTGFRDIDALLSGLHPGNLVVIAGRPGIGKSSLALNIARNVAVDGAGRVALFSLEMDQREIEMRLLCSEARVPWDLIRNKRVGAEDWKRIADAADALHDAQLFVVDSGNLTL